MTEPRTNRIQAAADAQARAARDLARLTKGGRDAGIVAAASLAVKLTATRDNVTRAVDEIGHLLAAWKVQGRATSARARMLCGNVVATAAMWAKWQQWQRGPLRGSWPLAAPEAA